LAADQDGGIAIGRLVQHEVRYLASVLVVPQLVEQGLAEAGALDRLQKLLGYDPVGIDIDHRQGRGNACQNVELLHPCLLRAGPRVTRLPRYLRVSASAVKAATAGRVGR